LVGLAAVVCLLPGWRTTGRPAWGAAAATVAFAVYILFRNRFSEVEYIGRLHFLIVAASLAVYLLFAFVLTRPHDRKIFFGFVIALCVLQLVPAAVQFFGQDGWMPLPFAQRRPGMWPGRVSGFFISPNNYAGFVEVGALLAAVQFGVALGARLGEIGADREGVATAVAAGGGDVLDHARQTGRGDVHGVAGRREALPRGVISWFGGAVLIALLLVFAIPVHMR
jgi:hypothetical protein